tara:strand:- start:2937 stop:4718 length:1782 start_codon:yes stop_codon:yes gene_type:complete
MASVTESILLSVQTRGTDSLNDAARSFDKVSKSADKAGKEIDDAGKRAQRTARKVSPLRDRLGDVATMFRDSGDGGMMFADALDAAAVATTPLGAGILGVVGAAGSLVVAVGAAVSAVNAYIETSESAQASSKRLSSGFEELQAAIGGVIFEGTALGDLFDGYGQFFSDVAADINKFRSATVESVSAQDRLKASITGVIGIFGPLAQRLASITGLTNSMAAAFANGASRARQLRLEEERLAKRRAQLDADIAEDLAELDDPAVRQRALAERQAKAKRIAAAQGRELSFDELYALGFEGATSPTSFEFSVSEVAPVGGGGGGGGGGAARKRRKAKEDAARRRAAESAALVGGLYGGMLQDPGFLTARAGEGGDILAADRQSRAEAAAAAKEAERRAAAAAKLRERLAAERRRALEAEIAAVERLAGTFREALQGSLADLGVTAARTFGEMTAGAVSAAGAMRSLAQEILNVGSSIGRTAAQRGVEGVIAGTAGAGGVLAGGLGIAAGAGLLGAILARRQQRRGGRRTGDSTARLADSIDRLEQTLRPDRADTPVTLNAEIVIAGRTVQQELTGALDSIVRTRSSRELFRAGIGR